MKVLLSWIREFVDIDESAEAIGRKLSVRGLALEGLEPRGHRYPARLRRHRQPARLPVDGRHRARDCRRLRPAVHRAVGTAALRGRGQHGLVGARALPITIEAPDLCGRYVGAVADVSVAPSPAWMAERLAACGVRPISNIVDITNYVLLELGHPMHAFDHARLAGPAIVVRPRADRRADAARWTTRRARSPTTCW